MVALLIDRGATINYYANCGVTPLEIAAEV